MSFLTEVDKLIQLLESPIFTYLRLQLLEPQRYAHLVKALYGLLMILPQVCFGRDFLKKSSFVLSSFCAVPRILDT